MFNPSICMLCGPGQGGNCPWFVEKTNDIDFDAQKFIVGAPKVECQINRSLPIDFGTLVSELYSD